MLTGIVNYTIAVTNKGPDTATDFKLADPAPGSFLAPDIAYLTANPSQGTCNLTPSHIGRTLGTITLVLRLRRDCHLRTGLSVGRVAGGYVDTNILHGA